MSSDEDKLETLLRRLADGRSSSTALYQEDIQLLASSLVYNAPRNSRSLGYLCVSKYCDLVRSSTTLSTDQDQIELVVTTFQPYFEATFHPDSDIPADSLAAPVSLLTALVSLYPPPALKILTLVIDDSNDPPLDILGLLLESAELPSALQPALAEFLGQATGTKAGRELVRSRTLEWLKGGVVYGSGQDDLEALCAVALSKLGREDGVPGMEGKASSSESQDLADEKSLCSRLMDSISQSQALSSSSLLSVIEGLSVLSGRPNIKEQMANSTNFLKSIVRLSPIPQARPSSLPVTPRSSIVSVDEDKLFEPVETGLCYGLATILVNLTNRPLPLSAEDQQMAKLRRMAISGKKLSAQPEEDEENPLERHEAIEARVQKVIKAGCVGALRGLGRAESKRVKELLGVLCLNLVENRENRSSFVRDGGYKVLSGVVRDHVSNLATLAKSKSPSSDTAGVLPSFQALAKLVITTQPTLLFPPPSSMTALNALSPLYQLLTHPSSTSLQTFEALMALTNLASIDPSIASRIAKASIAPLQIGPSADFPRSGQSAPVEAAVSIIGKVEALMLDDNTLVRRAAVQLVCNLVSSPEGFKHFSGSDAVNPFGMNSSQPASPRIISRLNVLMVLSNVDDLPTRLAAGGALAVLTESPKACQGLLAFDLTEKHVPATLTSTSSKKRSVWERLMWLFDPEDSNPNTTGGKVGADNAEEDDERLEVISSSLPNSDLVYRGVIILLNLLEYISSLNEDQRSAGGEGLRDAKVEEKLLGLLRMKFGDEILRVIVECLKVLKRV